MPSTTVRQVAAADVSEPELQIQPPVILDGDESVSIRSGPGSWKLVLRILQTPIHDDNIESSDHDPECLWIHTLVPVAKGDVSRKCDFFGYLGG